MQLLNKGLTNKWDMTQEDKITKAEILWTLKVASCGHSFASCDNLGQPFAAMFLDSKLAESFSLGQAKVALWDFTWIGTILSC